MARSVAELLPRPFAELEIADIEALVAVPADERETLYLELKREAAADKLAKSCAAFANTVGGLLIVGVEDDGTIVGIDRPAGEVPLWLKDILRPRVLPLPPFRARWLPLDPANADRGLLLALVEESSATPHLLLKLGAIYVRNPSSSDPLPIDDQRRLLDLFARGERARDRATSLAAEAVAAGAPFGSSSWVALSLAPTGVARDLHERLFNPDGSAARRLLGALDEAFGELQDLRPTYTPDTVTIARTRMGGMEPGDDLAGAATSGVVSVSCGHREGRHGGYLREQLEEMLLKALRAARELLLDFGAHGDVHLACTFQFRDDQNVHWNNQGLTFHVSDAPIVERWTTLEANDQTDRTLTSSILDELARAADVGPDIG